MDGQEQYSRKNCLLVHGTNEKNNKEADQAIINIARNNLGEEITIHDIDRTYCFGKRKRDDNAPRPIKIGFLKLKTKLREKCEHYRKSNKEKSN